MPAGVFAGRFFKQVRHQTKARGAFVTAQDKRMQPLGIETAYLLLLLSSIFPISMIGGLADVVLTGRWDTPEWF